MFRQMRHQSVWAAALCLTILGQGLLRADDVPAERRLPPGVLGFFTIPDATELKDRFMESGFGQMIQDDSLDEFRAQLSEGWEELSGELEEDLGMSAQELMKLANGEITFAVLQPPGRSFGMVAVLGFGEHRDTMDSILEKFREQAENEGADRTIETVEDTDITIFKKENEEGSPDTVAHFIRDERLVISVATGTDLLKDILVRWDGDHAQTFADDEIYSYIMQQCEPESGASQFRWYFSPIDLFRTVAMLPQMNQGGISPAMALGFLPALGLDKFKAMGGASSMGTEDYDGVSRMFLYVNQPTSGLVKFFESPAVRQEPPAWVPAGVAAYSSINWDVAGAYKAVEAVVDFFQPPGTLANAIEQIAQQGPQVHIKDDVIDSLTGRIQILGETREEVEAGGASPGVFALELRDEKKMADVMDRVAEFSDGNLNERDFRGVTIYEADLPNFQGGAPTSMGAAVAKGQFFFATEVQLLEDYLRNDEAEEPLANSTDYRRISAHFPSETSIIGFSRPAAQFKPVYEQFRTGQFDAFVEEIDFSTLPEFDALADYFTTSGTYAIPDDKGALIVQFTLRKE